jgi:hypothetical protein
VRRPAGRAATAPPTANPASITRADRPFGMTVGLAISGIVRMSGGRPISRHVAVGWHDFVPCAVAATLTAACPGNAVCLSGVVVPNLATSSLDSSGCQRQRAQPWRVAWQMPATQDGRYRHRPDRGCAIRSRRRSCSHPVRASSSDRTGRRRARNTSPSRAPVDQIKLGIAQRPAHKPVLHRTRLSAGWCVTEARHVQW